MNLAFRIDNNVVAVIISIVFLLNICNRLDKKDKKNLAFVILFILNTVEVFFETLTCIINKQPYEWLIPIAIILHVILFILGPIITYMCYVFVHFWVTNDEEFNLKSQYIMLIPVLLNALLVFSTPLTKWVFYINNNNVYNRGVLFFVSVAASYFYLLYSFMYIYTNKEKVNKVNFLPLLLFGVLPAIGGFLQAIFYGLLLMWSCTAWSLIIVFIYLQQQMMQMDNLTGAWTRDKLQMYLKSRIEQYEHQGFSIVFIDLDNFKKINDEYGHNEGDKVLKDFVDIVMNTLRRGDSITRYGGDEFVIFLNVECKRDVEAIMKRIAKSFEAYNKSLDKQYELSYSYGYELYDFNSNLDIDEYIDHVDKLMYEAKNNKKG